MGRAFDDLEVYQQARVLRGRVYQLTKLLPDDERRVLVPQMRRAALSVTNNIAEGHGSRSFRHNISYLYRARGSVCELIDDFGLCRDEGYFEESHLDDIRQHGEKVLMLINGYIRYLAGRASREK